MIEIIPHESDDDTRVLIPLSAVKMIKPYYIEEYDVLEGVGRALNKE